MCAKCDGKRYILTTEVRENRLGLGILTWIEPCGECRPLDRILRGAPLSGSS